MPINLTEIEIGKPEKFDKLHGKMEKVHYIERNDLLTQTIQKLKVGNCITFKTEKYNELRRVVISCAKKITSQKKYAKFKLATRTSFNASTNRNDGIIVYRIN